MAWKREFFAIFLAALLGAPAWAGDPTPEELKLKFQETLKQSRLNVVVSGDRLAGPGADYLRAQASVSRFVMIGEEHGVATIADVVRHWVPDLSNAGYSRFAIEVDPFMTAKLEAELRSGGTKALARMLSADDASLSLPFYSWDAEADLANTFVSLNKGAIPALWGLDQVFIGAYGLLLKDIAAGTTSLDASALAQSLAAQAHGDLSFLGKVDLSQFDKLRSLLSDPRDAAFAELADAMIASARIYAPFIGKEGLNAYAANGERENLMKRRFQKLYQQAGKPKVVFKFGSYHMTRGLSGTHVLSLASFVTDTALAEDGRSFSLLVLCGPGTKAASFLGDPGDCDMSVEKDFPDLAALVDEKQPTLFDLQPWKDKPRRWQHLSEEVRSLIWAYDAILFVPNGKPSRMMAQARTSHH